MSKDPKNQNSHKVHYPASLTDLRNHLRGNVFRSLATYVVIQTAVVGLLTGSLKPTLAYNALAVIKNAVPLDVDHFVDMAKKHPFEAFGSVIAVTHLQAPFPGVEQEVARFIRRKPEPEYSKPQ